MGNARKAQKRKAIDDAKFREAMEESEERLTTAKENAATRQVEAERLQHAAAGVIQRAYRTYDAKFKARWMKEQRDAERKAQYNAELNKVTHNAATKIQARLRGMIARRAFEHKMVHLNSKR